MAAENPLVSILMPFKNTAAFLPDCLDSILLQSYPHWELCAVNDHSEDESMELLHTYSSRDPRIMVMENTGQGIIHALRTAYAASSGQMITRMDSDDIMTPVKLQTMVQLLHQNGPGSVAAGLVHYFSDRGISNGYARYEQWINGLTRTGKNFEEIYKECAIPSPCWMTYRSDLDKCGGFDHDRYPEDYDLAFRFYQHHLKNIPCDKLLHLWRDYDTRTSRTHPHYAMNYFLDIKFHYFLKTDYQAGRDLAVWGAGNKGKQVARLLLNAGIAFTWLCDNPKKIGKKIYGIPMEHYSALRELKSPQSIITVANRRAQRSIRDYLAGLNQNPKTDHYFFC